jgi:hypothetical protein
VIRAIRVGRARPALLVVVVALSPAAGTVGTAGEARAAPSKPAPHPPSKPAAPAAPLAPLPMLPSVPRVKVDILKTQLVVVEEVNLPRGEWKNEALDFYVAFGAPGLPRAVDARLVAVADGAVEPEDDDAGEVLAVERMPHRPGSAHALLGKDAMAGVVVHVKRESLAKAFAPGNMAALRVRTALDLPEEDSGGARGVVVRLGSSRGTPLTLGRLTVSAKAGAPGPARAEAHLCGSEADPTPLAIAILPRPAAPQLVSAAPSPPPIAPVLAVRHASDDVCIRFWTPP